VYRYKIDWEPDAITWSVDLKESGNSYVPIHSQDMAQVSSYAESLCHVYISFWHGWTPDGSQFDGKNAKANCGEPGPCYQAFYFQPLKFTPSESNKLITLVD
jgi:beta-glucanase (GH16 family)